MNVLNAVTRLEGAKEQLKLAKIQRRIQENHRIVLSYEDAVVEEIARRCTEVESGARNVDNILTNTMLPEIGKEFLSRLAGGTAINRIHVSAKDGNFAFAFD